jgi:hypothetical protein
MMKIFFLVVIAILASVANAGVTITTITAGDGK